MSRAIRLVCRSLTASCLALILVACTTQPPQGGGITPSPGTSTIASTTPVDTEPGPDPSGPPVDGEAMLRIGELLSEADDEGQAVLKPMFAAIIRESEYVDERLLLSIDKVEVNPPGDPQEPRFSNAEIKVEKVDYLRPLVLITDGGFESIAPEALSTYFVPGEDGDGVAFQFYQSKYLTIIAEIYQA